MSDCGLSVVHSHLLSEHLCLDAEEMVQEHLELGGIWPVCRQWLELIREGWHQVKLFCKSDLVSPRHPESLNC